MCEGCAENVTKRLMNSTKGVNVAAVDVDLDTKIVKVSIDCESVVDVSQSFQLSWSRCKRMADSMPSQCLVECDEQSSSLSYITHLC